MLEPAPGQRTSRGDARIILLKVAMFTRAYGNNKSVPFFVSLGNKKLRTSG